MGEALDINISLFYSLTCISTAREAALRHPASRDISESRCFQEQLKGFQAIKAGCMCSGSHTDKDVSGLQFSFSGHLITAGPPLRPQSISLSQMLLDCVTVVIGRVFLARVVLHNEKCDVCCFSAKIVLTLKQAF